jgi:hypothetical protein
MGYREMTISMKLSQYPFRAIEVAPARRERDHYDGPASSMFILVDGDSDTLQFVQENLFEIVNNVLRVRKMKPSIRNIDENARIFERNLQSLFAMVVQERGSSLLDEMSHSLKKALIILAIERYRNDRERICKVFGISRDKLEQEMITCGLL